MKKFSFYVSNNGTRLQNFLIKYKNNSLIKDIKFVLIDNINNSDLRGLCKDLNIQFYEIDLEVKENKNEFISDTFLNYLDLYSIDNAFIFADVILVGDILKVYKNKLINFHPSLLPLYKGRLAIDRALKDNTFLLGNTAHFIDETLDGGSVIMQNIFHTTKFTKYDDVLNKQLIMILQLMYWINSDRLVTNNKKTIVLDASYNIEEFIPNIEIIDNCK